MINLSSGLLTALPSPVFPVVSFNVWTRHFFDDYLMATAVSPVWFERNILALI
jgi:hypothetical protein